MVLSAWESTHVILVMLRPRAGWGPLWGHQDPSGDIGELHCPMPGPFSCCSQQDPAGGPIPGFANFAERLQEVECGKKNGIWGHFLLDLPKLPSCLPPHHADDVADDMCTSPAFQCLGDPGVKPR